MGHSHEHEHDHHCSVKLCLKVVKVVLQAASVAAAFCAVKELHKIHHNLKEHKEHHHHLLGK